MEGQKLSYSLSVGERGLPVSSLICCVVVCRRAAVPDPPHRHHGVGDWEQPAPEHQGVPPAPARV